MSDVSIELNASPPKRGGTRVGAGRPSLVRANNIRIAQGLPPVPNRKEWKSGAILPEKKKARSQEILAEMLGVKSKNIVQKVLEKALDDNDKDQMECLKLVMDRIIPKDYMSKNSGNGNQINIQIMGIGETTDVTEGEYSVG